MTHQADYLRFYDAEAYLLGAGTNYRETGDLSAADFYMLLGWKANRAKYRHRDRLKRRAGSLENAVKTIASQLRTSAERKRRLHILMKHWGFALTTATVILTILYPDEFIIYDYSVSQEVGQFCGEGRFTNQLWSEYERFQAAVSSMAPHHLSLRDKNRFLTARLTRMQIERDCIA